MTKVYLRTGLGVAASLVTATALMPFVDDYLLPIFGIGAVMGLGCTLATTMIKPTYESILSKGQQIRITVNPPARELTFAAMTIGMGMIMAPMVSIITVIDPTILPISVLITGATFGTCAIVASRIKDTSIMAWKAPLMGGLFSLVGLQLAGLGSLLIFGPTSFDAVINSIDIYGGILLFTGLTAYDSHQARLAYVRGDPDHLGVSVNIYLDLMNLLIRIMEIMAKAKKH